MAITFQQFREKNPQYSEISDSALFDQLHESYYPNMPKAELAKAISFEIPDQPFSQDLQEFGHQALGGLVVDVPRTAGQAVRAFAPDDSLAEDWGKDVVKSAEERAPEYAYDESGKGLLAQAAQRGVRALPVSALAMGATAVNPVLGAAVTGGLFGGSAYQDTEDAVIAAGGTPEQAKEAGLKTGALNAGGELIGNYLGLRALGFGRKALEGTVNKALGKVTDDAILKPFGKALGAEMVGETLTEEAQTLGTEYIERQYNAGSGEEYGKLAKDALLTTAGLTALLGGGGIVGHTRNAMIAQKYDQVLADPSIHKDERSAVVQDLYQQFKASGIQDADNWLIGAKNDIDAGRRIRRDGTLDIPDVTQASSVDEAIVSADAALNWETPEAKVYPNTPLQQRINDQFQSENYVPGEVGKVWETPKASPYQPNINKPYPVTDADINAVKPEDMANILPKPTSLRERGLLERARNTVANASATGSNAERTDDIAGANGAITTPDKKSEIANEQQTELPNTVNADDLQDKPQQTPGHNFKPTHVLNDGYETPVQKIDDNLYLDSKGFEIEDYSATPINDQDNALPATGKEGQANSGIIDSQQGIEVGERRVEPAVSDEDRRVFGGTESIGTGGNVDRVQGSDVPTRDSLDNGALNKFPSGEKWIKSQDGYKAELDTIQRAFEQDKDIEKLKKAKHNLRKKWSEKYTEAKKEAQLTTNNIAEKEVNNGLQEQKTETTKTISEKQPDLKQDQNNVATEITTPQHGTQGISESTAPVEAKDESEAKLENIPDSFLDSKEYDVDVLENGVVESRAMTARARLENNQEQIDSYQSFINCMGG